MRNFLLSVIAAVVGLAAVARADEVNGIVVVVNDSVITYGEIQQGIRPQIMRLTERYASPQDIPSQELQKIRDEEIEALVERKLILHDFIQGGYSTNVLEAFIDDRIKDKIQRDYYGDRARLIKTLQAEGKTFETYRRDERENFIVDYMTYHNVNPQKIVISPLRIETYYNEHKADFKVDDQVKLRMIVILQPNDEPPGTAHKRAQEILDKINSGVSFAQMASEAEATSERPRNAQIRNGGDRGWVDRTVYKESLTKVAFSLGAGQHSGVIDEPEGSYLLMVEETRPAHVQSLVEVHGEIERKLADQEGRHLRDRWIERLKNKSFINYY
jgi:peptidyl-prolyl cis-trans isomerase SurA